MIPALTTKRSKSPRTKISLSLLVSASCLPLAPVVVAETASAQGAGVEALVQQAKYWRSKGREDLAQQALRRAHAIDPNNAALKAYTAAPKPAPAPKSAPVAKPAPAPKEAEDRPRREVRPDPQPVRQAAAPQPASQQAPAKPAPAKVSASDRAGQERIAGYDALNDNRLSEAESHFQRALSMNKRDADAIGGIGLVRLRQSNFTQAADMLEQASRLGNPAQWAKGLASARFFANLATARNTLAQGRTNDAQAQAEALVRSGYQDTSPALELLADIYEKEGRFADAADLYRQAGQGGGADEKRLQLRAARGRALDAASRGDDLDAQREFQSGMMIDPQDPWIRYEFAEFMIKRGRVPEAESLLQSLVANGSADSTYAAALLNNDLGRPAEAERLISMIPEGQRTVPMRTLAISVKTDNAISRARAMGKTGQAPQAIAALRQLGSMAAVPPGKQASVASALSDLGDQTGAVQVAQNALDGQITNMADYEGLIGVLARAGREDLAQQALQKAAQLAGSTPDGQRLYNRMQAVLLVSQADNARLAGRYAEAFDVLQQAYAAAPDNPDIVMGLARLYQSGGMPGKAAQSYQLVLARKPGDKDALVGLADTAQAAGDRQLSEQAEREVLRAFPQDYQVRLSLAQVERARGNERAAVSLLKDARALYTQGQNGTAIAGSNPFVGMTPGGGIGGNPFRNQPQTVAAAPQAVNPFTLGGGARLPAAYSAPVQGFGAQSSGTSAYGAQGVAQQPGYGTTQQGFGAAQGYPAQAGYAAPAGNATPAAYSAPINASAPAPSAQFGGYPTPNFAGQDATPVYSADPVLNQIQTDIASMAKDSGPRVEVGSSYRGRQGETGLSKLNQIEGTAKISTGAPGGGRVFAKAVATVVDAGRPTGSALQRFGTDATIEAQSIVAAETAQLVNADTQEASGVAFSGGYESDAVKIEAGTTPVGMGKTKFAGHAEVSPKLGGNVRATAFVERKPVTDSVLSYAGTRDPVTGERWGQVMRTAGGGGLSYDQDGTGVYVQGRYYSFRGNNTPNNTGYEANAGGYMRAYKGEHSNVTVGLNVNYQSYDKSQNYFTYGNGGYFSPQSFISIGFPINYTYKTDKIEASANVTPGFQSYKEKQSDLYPTDAAAQAILDSLKAQDNDVRNYFDSDSNTGFAVSASGSIYYRVSPNTRIGGDASYSTFGTYKEFRSTLGLRQSLGSTTP